MRCRRVPTIAGLVADDLLVQRRVRSLLYACANRAPVPPRTPPHTAPCLQDIIGSCYIPNLWLLPADKSNTSRYTLTVMLDPAVAALISQVSVGTRL